jgi:hypothetical protein
MKKKVFRERYANNVLSVKTFDEHIKNPKLEIKPDKTAGTVKIKKVSRKKEAK